MREVMWSHIIVQTMMMILQTIIVLVGFLSVLKITNDGPLGWVVLLCVLQGFCGMCLGEWRLGRKIIVSHTIFVSLFTKKIYDILFFLSAIRNVGV